MHFERRDAFQNASYFFFKKKKNVCYPTYKFRPITWSTLIFYLALVPKYHVLYIAHKSITSMFCAVTYSGCIHPGTQYDDRRHGWCIFHRSFLSYHCCIPCLPVIPCGFLVFPVQGHFQKTCNYVCRWGWRWILSLDGLRVCNWN